MGAALSFLGQKLFASSTLINALLPEGAYTGSRLAAWISSNFATATYSETTNSLSVAYDGNRLILNDLELQQQFPAAVDYPTSPAASPSKPFSIDHMLGPSFVSGGQQVFGLPALPPAGQRQPRAGQSGDDILSKITLKSGIVETGSDDGHFMAVRGPITLRHLRFRLTDLTAGLVVVLRAVFGSRLILRRSLKKIFSIKKTDEASAIGGKAERQAPGSKNKPKPPELPLPKGKKRLTTWRREKKGSTNCPRSRRIKRNPPSVSRG